MKLSKRQRIELAGLINGLQVATRIRAESAKQEDRHHWFVRECSIEIELAERFGIELPGLDVARNVVADDAAARRRAAA